MSPYNVNSNGNAYVFRVNSNGNLDAPNVNNIKGLPIRHLIGQYPFKLNN